MDIFKELLGIGEDWESFLMVFGKGHLDLSVCLYWLYIPLKQVWGFVLVVLLPNPQLASVTLKLAR